MALRLLINIVMFSYKWLKLKHMLDSGIFL